MSKAFWPILLSLFCIISCEHSNDWGAAKITRDADGHIQVVMENRRLLLEYGYREIEGTGEGLMKKFFLKEFSSENIPHTFEGAAHRGMIQNAKILVNRPAVKKVRIEWAPQAGIKQKYDRPAVTEVSIFPNQNFVKLDYKTFCYPHICDIGHPGGIPFKTASDTTARGEYVIYGARKWQQLRAQINAPELWQHENPHHRLTDDLFPCYPNPLIDHNWVRTENPLSYRGWYILGVYNPANGRGFGRVIPADIVPVIKLLWGKGFELFPFWNQDGITEPFTSYVFISTNGADGILKLGKSLVDQEIQQRK